jgi:hypothetical protein
VCRIVQGFAGGSAALRGSSRFLVALAAVRARSGRSRQTIPVRLRAVTHFRAECVGECRCRAVSELQSDLCDAQAPSPLGQPPAALRRVSPVSPSDSSRSASGYGCSIQTWSRRSSSSGRSPASLRRRASCAAPGSRRSSCRLPPAARSGWRCCAMSIRWHSRSASACCSCCGALRCCSHAICRKSRGEAGLRTAVSAGSAASWAASAGSPVPHPFCGRSYAAGTGTHSAPSSRFKLCMHCLTMFAYASSGAVTTDLLSLLAVTLPACSSPHGSEAASITGSAIGPSAAPFSDSWRSPASSS